MCTRKRERTALRMVQWRKRVYRYTVPWKLYLCWWFVENRVFHRLILLVAFWLSLSQVKTKHTPKKYMAIFLFSNTKWKSVKISIEVKNLLKKNGEENYSEKNSKIGYVGLNKIHKKKLNRWNWCSRKITSEKVSSRK